MSRALHLDVFDQPEKTTFQQPARTGAYAHCKMFVNLPADAFVLFHKVIYDIELTFSA
jgi:hypothetical protein